MDSRIEQIVRHFDWHRVEKTMRELKWIWVSSEQEDSIPSLGELFLTALDLLEQVSEQEGEYLIGTGGFEAYRNEYGDLGLRFNLASAEGWEDEC